jgi:hypothetical protein
MEDGTWKFDLVELPFFDKHWAPSPLTKTETPWKAGN